jgi:hypothetical protein
VSLKHFVRRLGILYHEALQFSCFSGGSGCVSSSSSCVSGGTILVEIHTDKLILAPPPLPQGNVVILMKFGGFFCVGCSTGIDHASNIENAH